MNTLKPLLTVAVLAGIGYGVYIRLNTGGNGPPPVAADWNNAPAIELPGQTSAAPWGPGGEVATNTPAIPQGTVTVPGGEAPAFQPPPGVAGPAQAGSDAAAPPFNPGGPGGAAPPFEAGPSQSPVAHETAPPATASEPGGAAAAPPGNPYDQPPADFAPQGPSVDVPGADAAASSMPSGDPYGAPPGADPYGAGGESYGAASEPPPSDMPASPDDIPPAGVPAAGSAEFEATFAAVQRDLENGQLASALRQLTPWYGSDQLSPPQQQQLQALLDQVAGTVVYSTQNLLEHPYEVQPGERLEAIGEKFQVPWQLLAKINGIEDPASLQPGERLKVVRGPFEAVVSLDRKELVLHTADGLYAGRFPIGVGADYPPQEGAFVVSDKVENPVYYGRQQAIGAEDPNNPLGERWIGLGRQMAIHGTNDPQNIGRTGLPGSISLQEPDVEEVFDILSLGSKVTIRR